VVRREPTEYKNFLWMVRSSEDSVVSQNVRYTLGNVILPCWAMVGVGWLETLMGLHPI
jgi:hypothetical protein